MTVESKFELLPQCRDQNEKLQRVTHYPRWQGRCAKSGPCLE